MASFEKHFRQSIEGLIELDVCFAIAVTFGLCVASGVVPIINGEMVLVGFILKSPAQGLGVTVALVLAAALGDMVAKIGLYLVGSGVLKLSKKKEGRIAKSIKKYQAKMEANASAPSMLLFMSGSIGLPPFYFISILAGTFKIPFARFLLLGSVGRIIRFSVVAFFPELWKHHTGA